MRGLAIAAAMILAGISAASGAAVPKWTKLNNVAIEGDAYRATGGDPWMATEKFDQPLPAEKCILLMEVQVSRRERMQVFWGTGGKATGQATSVEFYVSKSDRPIVMAVDLGQRPGFGPVEQLRLDPSDHPGLQMTLKRFELVARNEIPEAALPSLLQFECRPSKLHYRPGERIEYMAAMNTRNYPDRASSKILEVRVEDEQGRLVGSAIQHYGLHPQIGLKEFRGTVEIPAPLAPGKYKLTATTTDQRTGFTLTTAGQQDGYSYHTIPSVFGVQTPDDPFVYEAPFKYMNDFSTIRGDDGRWHVFAITQDFPYGDGWTQDGQARTFSHGSSADLRNWTYHKPVLSVTNNKYPDGKEFYQSLQVWAPHVIRHNGTYYMFYVSVNDHVSQSISVATSKDLMEWKECPGNPVFTLEGVKWAEWSRGGWADCRDPVVLEDGGKFYLYVTARQSEKRKSDGECGLIVVAESKDLLHWKNPRVAVEGRNSMESPQVWKSKGHYYMTTSAAGSGVFESDDPVTGWRKSNFSRLPVQEREKYIEPTGGSRIEEVVRLPDGQLIMTCGASQEGSIYFYRVIEDEKTGKPIRYESPF